ncbi:hypothetical protein [Ensifer soli]|uniref:hypothetical protein n=1 Tax=Ciceribacter sp. sgz301302 TaxID=3342379 RepID=UPI0035BAEACF
MKILFEVPDGDAVAIHDPGVPASTSLKGIAREATLAGAARILTFCPDTLEVADITPAVFAAYAGAFDEDAPPFVRLHPDFDDCAADEARHVREWAAHIRAFRRVA